MLVASPQPTIKVHCQKICFNMSPIIPDWNNIDTVLLDMDGTLLDLHFDSFFWLHHLPRRYSEQHGVDVDEARLDIRQRMASIQGTLDWYCTDFWSGQLNVDIVELKREVLHLVGERPQVLEFLKALGNQGKQRILITNAHRDSVDIKFSVTAIEPHLDLVISSHDYGYPKENQLFWQQLQENMPFDPARTLFIDDSEPVLRSAEKYGIAHLLCIDQPDSQQQARLSSGFQSLANFQQILNLKDSL